MWTYLLKDYNLLGAAIILAIPIILSIIILYRRNIGALIDRISVQGGADTLPLSQQKSDVGTFGNPSNIAPDSKYAAVIAARIVSDMEKSFSSPEERLRALANLAANHMLKGEFEFKYRIAFKSQIEALAGLRQKGPHPLDPYYQTYLSRIEERKEQVSASGIKTDFETWVRFLAGPGMCYIEIENGVARITDLGDAFMEFTSRTVQINHIL